MPRTASPERTPLFPWSPEQLASVAKTLKKGSYITIMRRKMDTQTRWRRFSAIVASIDEQLNPNKFTVTAIPTYDTEKFETRPSELPSSIIFGVPPNDEYEYRELIKVSDPPTLSDINDDEDDQDSESEYSSGEEFEVVDYVTLPRSEQKKKSNTNKKFNLLVVRTWGKLLDNFSIEKENFLRSSLLERFSQQNEKSQSVSSMIEALISWAKITSTYIPREERLKGHNLAIGSGLVDSIRNSFAATQGVNPDTIRKRLRKEDDEFIKAVYSANHKEENSPENPRKGRKVDNGQTTCSICGLRGHKPLSCYKLLELVKKKEEAVQKDKKNDL